MNEDWLHKVRDRMADYETDEPEHLWDAIKAKLDEPDSGLPPRRRFVVPMWLRRSAAAVAIVAVLVAMVVYLARVRPDMSDVQLPATAGEVSSPSVVRSNEIAEIIAREADTPEPAARLSAARVGLSAVSSMAEEGPSRATDQMAAETVAIASAQPSVDDTANQSAYIDSVPGTTSDDHRYLLTPVRKENGDAYEEPLKSSRTSRFSLALYSSGATTGGLSENEHDETVSSPGDILGQPGESGAKSLPLRKEMADGNMKHHIPIRAGVLFAYNINSRMSIESGISYAYLSSTTTGGTPRDHFERGQTLQYIGVPVNLKYRLLSWKRLSLYASAGVLGEKCFSAKTSIRRVHNNFVSISGTSNLPEKPLQWSVNAAVGVQCRIVGAVSLFVEPGFGYYFDDGSGIRTVYSDTPLNFNLNMGLRFSFGE